LPEIDESTWMVSVEVADVRAAIAKAESLGAQLLEGPVTDNEYATWAVIEDPQGAQLSLVVPNPTERGERRLVGPLVPDGGTFCCPAFGGGSRQDERSGFPTLLASNERLRQRRG
jgi:hypothetical protein